ncbi:MAG: hypothetical protein GQ553_04490 [Nitrosomonadaceae bacterium]|nr:hypothetical protein [Nitrosomonadaceae bacterium]
MSSLTSREKLQAKALLLGKAKGKEITPWEKTDRRLMCLTEQECKNLVSWAGYTGKPLTNKQIIEQAYPSCELIIQMNDGRVFTLNTDSYDLDTITGRYIDLQAYLEAFGMLKDWEEDKEFFEGQRAEIRIPGAKNIFYMEC